MAEYVLLNAFKCRMWKGHERLEEHVNEETCREEIRSVMNHGQQIPVLARPLRNDLEHSYELIYGARRLFVARYLNLQLKAEVREMSDREAIIALDMENRLRKDFSPYERGRSFLSWLRTGMFTSQDELASVLNVSSSQLSRLLKLAQLPAVIVSAFNSPTDICETWGRDLMPMWSDPITRAALIDRARRFAKDARRPAAPAIYQQLVASAGPRQTRQLDDHDEVVKDDSGKPLFRIRVHRKNVALLLPAIGLSQEALGDIKSHVASVLQRRARHKPNIGDPTISVAVDPEMVELEEGREVV